MCYCDVWLKYVSWSRLTLMVTRTSCSACFTYRLHPSSWLDAVARRVLTVVCVPGARTWLVLSPARLRGAGKDKMELLLSMGGSRWEASREIIQRCVKLAMTPVLNQMNVVGIVSIPGMMTGQILGGTDPSQARPMTEGSQYIVSIRC